MTFQPLIHSNTFLMLGTVIVGALLITAIIAFLTYLYSLGRKRKVDFSNAMVLVLMLSGMFIFFGWDLTLTHKNEEIVRANVSQKYQVEELTFAPRGRGVPDNVPDQSEAQPVTIKSNGNSLLAKLIQNSETSEPTLLNVDTNEPLNNLLRTQP